jgi:transposase, IS30 family
MNHYTHLTMEDRLQFYALIQMKYSFSEISRRMNKHRSTLYRELARNKIKDSYKPAVAHKKALARKVRKSSIQKNPTLREYVHRHLKISWSPEQISGRLTRKKSKYRICHETIYRYIYKHKPDFHHYLPYKKPKRIKPCARKPQTCRFGEKRLITQRPESIGARKHYAHWEGDTIEFKGNKKSSITTLVERKSRLLFLIKNETKVSDIVIGKIHEKFSSFSEQICKSITFDQGGEFASFHLLESPLNCNVYYCHGHAPWEKGGNENMNGRLRWILPKNKNIDEISQEELDRIASRMNNTPRKCLDYRTPKELFLRRFKQICRTSL